MHNTPRNIHQRPLTIATMFLIGLHLIQRLLTFRFLLGLILGVSLTLLLSSSTSSSDQPKFRADQSKFEYEKNRPENDGIDNLSPSLWNNSWDGLRSESTVLRHLYLIRHGQYFDNARTMEAMKLTPLGREQIRYTGQRLNQLNVTFNRLIHSGMVRALESAQIIQQQLIPQLDLTEDKNLTEGLPVAPVPYAGISQQYVDSIGDRARVDYAFAQYFHRARKDQTKDSHDILVFHANILRYFICKIMQFPVQGWLRITLNHGSITQITILSDGNVVMKAVGDSGFIPPNQVTF